MKRKSNSENENIKSTKKDINGKENYDYDKFTRFRLREQEKSF